MRGTPDPPGPAKDADELLEYRYGAVPRSSARAIHRQYDSNRIAPTTGTSSPTIMIAGNAVHAVGARSAADAKLLQSRHDSQLPSLGKC
jgi:hypothetical protein